MFFQKEGEIYEFLGNRGNLNILADENRKEFFWERAKI